MLILASLLGMMALGSIMLIEPNSSDSENEDDEFLSDNEESIAQANVQHGGGSETDLLSYIDTEGTTQTLENVTTDADDVLIGTTTADVQSGGLGDDKIMSRAGNDTANGDDGNDVIHGNEGDDVLNGNLGLDTLFGDQGDDLLVGGDDNDTIVGSSGNDSLIGGAGADVLFAGTGDDVLHGLENSDQNTDFLNGGEGNDTIFAGDGDEVDGGLGFDTTVLLPEISEPVKIWNFEKGQDTIVLLYDAEALSPDVSISKSDAAADKWLISANDTPIAHVQGDEPSLSDVTLLARE